ncbi:uncharacterized protein LOC112572022 [Pomacea canaliculata]|uniref:uncharacterized protein LOC112572022 n=1 Tax=Pomacea canaliculata TaxID=400727 RepID=UPI000D73C882|nr:uncharacterized protein LOC112572022 [Pomacea canaliculata]XP_025107305.1 uncharacterized protein LOC112572022 [Pomacea canaliculata]
MRSPAGRQCGEVSGVNLQVAAALLWAVQLLNGDLSPQGDSFIPGIHLELQVYDDCSQEILAARLVSEVLNIHPNNCVLARPPLAGVIGTSISPTTTRIASLLADTHVPQFGVSATLPELSYSSLYPSFFRTVPSDLMQSKVLVQMVTRLKWNYVAGMYTRDNYGTQGFQEFKRLAAEAGICIFREQSFLHSDSDMEDQMEVFVRMLLIDMVNTGNSLGVVYFGQSLEARRLFQMIQDRRAKWHDQQKFNQIHWVFSDGVGTSVEVAKRITEYSSTFLSISPAPLPLRDFRRFFVDLLRSSQKPDPYWSTLLAEYIAQKLPCDPGASSSCDVEMSFHISDYLPAALDAIYSLAALLKTAHKLRCPGGGLCPELMEAVRGGLLQSVQPTALNYSEFFDNDYVPEEFRNNRVLVSNEYGDFVAANMPLYYISMARSGAWKKIGEYTNGSVSIDASADFTNVGSSECRTSCTQCRRSDTSVFYHQPGDLLLLGLYSIHKPESPTSFRCGQYRGQSSSVVALEAFLQTLQALAADEGHQPGVAYPRVGGLVLDDCYNSLTAVSLLSGLFSKKINLTSSSTGEVIDMDKVVAVIGSQSSTVTLSSLSVLTPLRMPMISYSSTSADLNDRVSYPFFSRTVPSDSVQARALLNLAKLMNVTYLGAFHQNNNYGIRGMQSFIAMAEEAGVCVETSIPLEESTSQVELLSHLRYLGNQDVKVIVAFVTQPTAVNILDALQGYSVNFVFLASEAWGTGPGTLQGVRGMKARGSLVLTVDTTREVGGVDMETYLRGLTPASAITDTWTRDMWEALMMCNLPGSFENEYPSPCNQSARILADTVKTLAHDQKVVQTINSVYSVVNALRSLCSSQSSQTAAAECAARVDGEGLTRAIRTVELRDKSGQTFRPFLDSGNGNTGFTVYNVQKTSSSGYAYVKVGSYDPSTGLNVQRGDLVFYNQLGQPQSAIISSCAHKDRCAICNNAEVTATPGPLAQPTSLKQDNSGPLVAGVAVLGVVCILLLVLLGVGVLLARRSRVLTLKIFGRYGRRNGAHTNGNNGLESRRDPGRINSAFTPTSPRVSLPLPPLPTGDYDRCSLSSPSPSTNSQAAREPTPSLRGQTSQQSPSRMQHPQFENLQQTEAFRLQELWPRQRQQQQQEEEENVSGLWTESQGRPRSSSTPRPVRPNFLPLREARQLDNNHSCSSECLGVGQKSQRDNFRPRAWSDDAAAGKRLGKLTELDRQLIAYFINRQKQGVNTSSGVQDTSDPVRRDQLTALGAQYQGQQRRQSSPQHANLQTMLLPPPTEDARPTTLQASRPHPVTYVPVPAGGALGHGMYLHAIPSCNSSLYLHAVAGSCTGLQTPNIPKSGTEGHSTSAGSDVASPGHFVTFACLSTV